jgi:ABC-type Fe3+-citrate transport system substrate-binding protein
VKIAESYDYNFHIKPQFLYYKNGGKKYRYDNQFNSLLDYFAAIILKKYLNKHVEKLINKNTKERKESRSISENSRWGIIKGFKDEKVSAISQDFWDTIKMKMES